MTHDADNTTTSPASMNDSSFMNVRALERVQIYSPSNEEDTLPSPIDYRTAQVAKPKAIVPPPTTTLKATKAYFRTLNQWQGYVLEKNDDTFRARIRDLTDPQRPEEEIVLDMDEVSEAEWELVAPGAIFYFYIGYKVDESGQRFRAAVIKFRCAVPRTKSEIEKIERSAARIARILGSEKA